MGKNDANLRKARAAQKESARERGLIQDLIKDPMVLADLGFTPNGWRLGDGQEAIGFKGFDLVEEGSDSDNPDAEAPQWLSVKEMFDTVGYELARAFRAATDNYMDWTKSFDRTAGDVLIREEILDRVLQQLGKLCAHSDRLLIGRWTEPLPDGRLMIDRHTGVGKFMFCEFCRNDSRVTHPHPDIFKINRGAPIPKGDFIVVYSWIFEYDKFDSIQKMRTVLSKQREIVKMFTLKAQTDLLSEFHRKVNKETVAPIDLVDWISSNDYKEKRTDEPVTPLDRADYEKDDEGTIRFKERIRTKQTMGLSNSVGQGTVRAAMPAGDIALANLEREELTGRIVWRVEKDEHGNETREEIAEIEGWATHPNKEIREVVRLVAWLQSEDSLMQYTPDGYSRLDPAQLSREWSRLGNLPDEKHAWKCVHHINNVFSPLHATDEPHKCTMVMDNNRIVNLWETMQMPFEFDRGIMELQVSREFSLTRSALKTAMGILHDGKRDYLGFERLPDGTWSNHAVDDAPKTEGIRPIFHNQYTWRLRNEAMSQIDWHLEESRAFLLKGYRHGPATVNEDQLRDIAEKSDLNFKALKAAAKKVWIPTNLSSNIADKFDREWLNRIGDSDVPVFYTIPPVLGQQFKGIPSIIWVDGNPMPADVVMENWSQEPTPLNLGTGEWSEDEATQMILDIEDREKASKGKKAGPKKIRGIEVSKLLEDLDQRVREGHITPGMADVLRETLLAE